MRTANEPYDIFEHYEVSWQMLGETICQYQAEVNHYGDAWPGAAIEIADGQRYLRELRARLPLGDDAQETIYFPGIGYCYKDGDPNEDIPF